jgi:hypothetical protein
MQLHIQNYEESNPPTSFGIVFEEKLFYSGLLVLVKKPQKILTNDETSFINARTDFFLIVPG